MPRIIISYRRDDSLDITGRIFDRLAGHFGREAIFRDIDNIPPGADFRRYIDRVLDESDIVLAIVGPRWIGPGDQQLRLASAADPVRLEIETALRKNKPLIPVLVSRAVMPHPDALPDSLHDFAYHNAVQVDSGQDFDVHVGRLIRGMERIMRFDEERAAGEAGPSAAAIEPASPIEPTPKAEPPVDPVAPFGWPFRKGGGRTVRWAICLRLVVTLGVIGAGGWWVFVERPAEIMRQEAVAAENERVEEQARQAAKAQVEDALKKEKPDKLDAKVYAKAMPLFRIAAEQGNADAQVKMGSFYENGRGVTQDYAEAMGWYRKAADQGDPEGQMAVGLLYEYGRGVPQDYGKAMGWYRMAADQGDRYAQKLIGRLYSDGLGVRRDLEQASQWFSKGAAEAREGGASASEPTAPTPRPTSSPIPNTGVAALPSNAAPGFPSGDN
jgi:hypothetical protein